MVTQVLALTRSGLTDFVVQRLTAVILGAYSLCLLGYFLGDNVNHAGLVAFFWSPTMQIFSTLAVLSISIRVRRTRSSTFCSKVTSRNALPIQPLSQALMGWTDSFSGT